MKFKTRTKEEVFADLKERLQSLPIRHPDRTILMRMIQDLGHELGRSSDGDETQLGRPENEASLGATSDGT